MTAPSQRTLTLMTRKFAGESTPAEEQELESIIGSMTPAKQQWYRNMLDPEKIADAMEFAESVDLRKHQQQWEADASQKGLPPQPGAYRISGSWIAVAAAIIILFGIAIWKLDTQPEPPPEQATAILARKDTGEDYIQLPNGEKIGLDALLTGTVRAGNTILSRQDSIVVCTAVQGGTGAPIDLRLFVKKAGYTLVLTDNSRITLDRKSDLLFPSHFEGKERKVQLRGHAYFEVAHKDADTFKVSMAAHAPDTLPHRLTEVQAIGTRFEIRAYANDAQTRVSLLEGSVRICKNASAPLLLNAGEEALFTLAGAIEKRKIENTNTITAWRVGEIAFYQTDILTIMRDIERHYDGITINVAKEVAKEKISLNGSYNQSIDELVNFLITKNRNRNIAFRKDGNTLYVTRSNK